MIFWPALLSETLTLDLLNNGDLLSKDIFLALDVRMGERLVLMRAELFSVRFLEDVSFWGLKKMRAGVEFFFFDEEKAGSVG